MKKQQGGDKKAGSQGKKKKACITWEENAFNTSSESSNEEEANLCLMVDGEADSAVSSSYSKSSENYDWLLDAFNEVHEKAQKWSLANNFLKG